MPANPGRRGEEAADEGAATDRRADHHVGVGEAAIEVGVRIGLEGGVDEPRLQRSAVEGPEHAHQRRHDGEQQHGVGHQQQRRWPPATPPRTRPAPASGRPRRPARRSAARGTASRSPARRWRRRSARATGPRDCRRSTKTVIAQPDGHEPQREQQVVAAPDARAGRRRSRPALGAGERRGGAR